jgi:hypothetical protein
MKLILHLHVFQRIEEIEINYATAHKTQLIELVKRR